MIRQIKLIHWLILSVFAFIGACSWILLSLGRYQMMDVRVDRAQAIHLAKEYLDQRLGVKIDGYQQVAIFAIDTGADRYLQRTLGVEAGREFLKNYDLDLFYWKVRFFKEGQKEEWRVVLSAKTAQIIGFAHTIADTDKTADLTPESAQAKASEFLSKNSHSFPQAYTFHSQTIEKKENRVDYQYSWEHKQVDIPWDTKKDAGKAKMVMYATVSGDKMLYFSNNYLRVPDGFTRHIEKLKQTGENLMLAANIINQLLLVISIMLLVNRKRFVIPRAAKHFYFSAGAFLVICIFFFSVLNNYQHLLFGYETTQSLSAYIGRGLLSAAVSILFTTGLVFILPGLSAEALRFEVAPSDKSQGFVSSVLSSFLTTSVARQIWVGYLTVPILLGLQAVIFAVGFNYFGVWNELSWLVGSSTAVVPALSVFAFGLQAAITEEILFRAFAVNFLRRYGLPSWAAVCLSALMWGLGHSGYEVFPMWFRVAEVSCIGILLGFIYLRFGLLSVIVAHFLADAFFASLQYLIKPQLSVDFISCVVVLLIPFIFSLVAFRLKRSETERSWRDAFSPQQEFNYQLLKQICASKTDEELVLLKKELVMHGWDPVIIERVFQAKIKNSD